MKAEFITSAADTGGFPETSLPEIAFIGRSNVGKSSMINALLGRKKLVKVGNTPGKTKLINFFNIEDKYIFVDLPGYGYAKTSKAERKKWGRLIENYLKARKQLKACVLIIDIRRIPSGDDFLMIEWLSENEIPIILTATKKDKVSRNELDKHISKIAEALSVTADAVLPFSATRKDGVEMVWNNITYVLKGEKEKEL
ncbi:GTP-binding protein engB [Flexistipes sinusarabici DSM 4947]|uniref:Probable GTP-binding protein EngB n=2 Tax=Flexistipes sinusarabici TaxID=2352 RepID=F8E9G0_FLESM|nr:ribosome biogenesis GTP-binding protein YihA/YsxC [Flexistipes sinusarabici]AEI14212.1 GTP-binding protein engB [Flexistipes sinusarabici DSM 4947]HCW93813.1 YihA family ribosome biogenesis GTP-binding protein [Flexistipes sinusarabici]